MSFKVYPYKPGSASAKALAGALEGKVLKHVGSKYRPKRGDVVINWGSSAVPGFAPATTLNPDVTKAGDKLSSFQGLDAAGVRVPKFVTTRAEAERLDFPVVCRTKLRGHSGDGIVVAEKQDELVAAPLYTQYVKKKDEYRVHVLRGGVFFIQRKARKLDVEEPNWRIRNLAGGFVFAEVAANEVPKDVLDQARAAIVALGLDFGGVDVMWNEREGVAYVLEINTACGLEDRTAAKYSDEILRLFPN
jgi:glutathione synthase/RimK-type ligase-like ATP-grasp enzyme